MLKNHLTFAIRNLLRNKTFSAINILGLSIGISSALVIYLIVRYEFSFDRSYPDKDRIYRVVNVIPNEATTGGVGGVDGAMPEAAGRQVTGISQSAPFYFVDEFALNHTGPVIPGTGTAAATTLKFKYAPDMILADQRYFDLFPYRWLAGTKHSLNRPYSVVLTDRKAAKYFPGLPYDQVLGKPVIYGDSVKATVTGIVATLTGNTDLDFNEFLSYSTADHVQILKANLDKEHWGSLTPSSQFFVKLAPNTSVANVETQLNDLLKKNLPPPPSGTESTRTVTLEKLRDIHFDEQYSSYFGRTANKSTLYGLLIIAAFLLVLACINFINLSTAQSVRRAKEVGVRKTLGGSRGNLFLQFLSETFLVTLLAMALSCMLTPLILKLFAEFIPAGVTAESMKQYDLLLFLLSLTIIVSIVAGFYPAMVLSRFKPVTTLKNQLSNGETRTAFFRKALTVSQFAIALFFIMATMMVGKQVYYALHKDLGFRKEAILTITTPWNKGAALRRVYINEISSLPQVRMISVGGASPSSDQTHSTHITRMNGSKEITANVQERFGDNNYINVYGIRLLAGRNVNAEDSGRALLISQSCSQTLGFSHASDAVNTIVTYNGKPMRVAGVTGDFYYRSLHSSIEPVVIVDRSDNGYFSCILHIALRPERPENAGSHDWQTAIASMQASFQKIFPNDEFEYGFFDDAIAKLYESERHTTTLLTWATALSIVISCLGLLGLAIYTVNRRTKEIGVRKVLGATIFQILTLLSTEIVWLIGLAFLIISPVAWWAMHRWMQNFADRTPISWWIFAISGGGMLLVALLTTSLQTLRAARANPVNSLGVE